MFNPTIWLAAATLLAVEPNSSTADLKPQVTQLVRQLDASEKAQREEAEQRLLELGPAVLPLLPDTARASAEVKLRLARVRTQLETKRSEEDSGARLVTLTADELTLPEAIIAIEKQTGNKLIDYRQQFNQQTDEKKLHLKLEKVPFWQAVDQLLDEASMTVYGPARESGLALVNRSNNELARLNRGAYAGAFRIEATEVIAKRDLRNPTGENLRVEVEVAWEPRLAPIGLRLAGESVTAVGDTGEELKPSEAGGLEVSVNPDESSAQVALSFALPPRAMTKITSLKGNLEALLPGPVEAFRFPKLQPGAKAEERRAGVNVILEQVRRNQELWEVHVRVVFDKPGQALESYRTWVLHNDVLLETPDKETIRPAGMETTRQTETEVGVAYLFDMPDLAGHTFVYKTPTVLINALIPYELKDITLP